MLIKCCCKVDSEVKCDVQMQNSACNISLILEMGSESWTWICFWKPICGTLLSHNSFYWHHVSHIIICMPAFFWNTEQMFCQVEGHLLHFSSSCSYSYYIKKTPSSLIVQIRDFCKIYHAVSCNDANLVKSRAIDNIRLQETYDGVLAVCLTSIGHDREH